jgi:hypothetical protein
MTIYVSMYFAFSYVDKDPWVLWLNSGSDVGDYGNETTENDDGISNLSDDDSTEKTAPLMKDKV